MVLRQLGLRVLLIDRERHPRFAIGESSTPSADFTLERLAERYRLPQLAVLARYGRWRRELPAVRRGLKRGFSYFHHEPGEVFRTNATHANQLLVAASGEDEWSDTHWLRADVDRQLLTWARELGVDVWEEAEFRSLETRPQGWRVHIAHEGVLHNVAAPFVIDASGAAAVVASRLQNSPAPTCRTHTRAVFTHLEGVASWSRTLREAHATTQHPFDCDAAAQHHLLGEDGWLWLLRFDCGLTSVGLVRDMARRTTSTATDLDETDPGDSVQAVLERYPSVAGLLEGSSLAGEPGRWLASKRLQRRLPRAAGPGWAALPNTAGFIDPLHSTGIAHALIGVERLAAVFESRQNQADKLPQLAELTRYDQLLQEELDWIDLLVAGCYRCLPSFDLFVVYSMAYFAAATVDERRRKLGADDPWLGFLAAEDAGLRHSVQALFDKIPTHVEYQTPAGEFAASAQRCLRRGITSGYSIQTPATCTDTRPPSEPRE